jgi:hypothetical protein
MEKKMTTPTEVLCRGFPPEFTVYLNYVRSLRFDDKPDYTYLRRLFRDLFIRQGCKYDFVFDWTIFKHVSARALHTRHGRAMSRAGLVCAHAQERDANTVPAPLADPYTEQANNEVGSPRAPVPARGGLTRVCAVLLLLLQHPEDYQDQTAPAPAAMQDSSRNAVVGLQDVTGNHVGASSFNLRRLAAEPSRDLYAGQARNHTPAVNGTAAYAARNARNLVPSDRV